MCLFGNLGDGGVGVYVWWLGRVVGGVGCSWVMICWWCVVCLVGLCRLWVKMWLVG